MKQQLAQKQWVTVAMVTIAVYSSVLAMQSAYAAGSMDVDDAQVLDVNKCQLETWGKFNRGGTERWFNPSCNLTGNLEVSWGNAWQRDGADMVLTNSQLQGKTVFRALSANGVGVGMLAGIERQTDRREDDNNDGARRRSWNYYTKLLTSFSFQNDAALVHTNIGLKQLGQEHATRLTWGVGNETRLHDKLWLIAEVFGENQGKPSYQAGIRATLVPEHMELDLTYGNIFGNSTQERYIVLGLRFISPKLSR